MSVENFKKFGQLCAEDEAIRGKVKEIGIENIDGWIAYSKNELGLEFTKDDMQALAAETGPVDELSEDQLEQVAGGLATSTVGAVLGAVGGVAAAAGAVGGAALAIVTAVRRW